MGIGEAKKLIQTIAVTPNMNNKVPKVPYPKQILYDLRAPLSHSKSFPYQVIVFTSHHAGLDKLTHAAVRRPLDYYLLLIHNSPYSS